MKQKKGNPPSKKITLSAAIVWSAANAILNWWRFINHTETNQ